MSNTFKHTFSILISVMFFAVSIIVVVSFDKPLLQSVINLRTENNNLKKDIIHETELNAKTNEIIKRYKSLSDIVGNLNAVLPREIDNADLIQSITNTANTSGVRIRSINVSLGAIVPPTVSTLPVKGYGSINIALNTEGSYQAIKQFIQKIEINGRLMQIKNLQVTGSSERVVANYQMTVVTYYQL